MYRLAGIIAVLVAFGSGSGLANASSLWGSIYFSMNSTTGQYVGGISWSYDSHNGARRGARQACSDRGGIGCREVAWFRNACGAISVGQRGHGAGWGDSLSAAKRISIAKCQKAARNCRIVEARCAKNDRKLLQGDTTRLAPREIQFALASQGFDPGPLDGRIGPKTRSAISAWQRAHGYAPTGRLTPKQSSALQNAKPPKIRIEIQPGTPSGLQGGIAVSDPKMGIYADEGIFWGFGWTEGTSSEALQLARRSCSQSGGVRCTSSSRGKNFVEYGGCLSIAIGETKGYGTGGSRTAAVAENNARVSCSMNDTNCRIIETQCAGRRVRFVDPATAPSRIAKATTKTDSRLVFEPKCDGRVMDDLSGCWKEFSNKRGCHIFLLGRDRVRAEKANFTWSGSCSEGSANGNGKLRVTFSREYKVFDKDGTGALSGGKMEGHWTWNYAGGQLYPTRYAYKDEGSYKSGWPVGRWRIYGHGGICWITDEGLVGSSKC